MTMTIYMVLSLVLDPLTVEPSLPSPRSAALFIELFIACGAERQDFQLAPSGFRPFALVWFCRTALVSHCLAAVALFSLRIPPLLLYSHFRTSAFGVFVSNHFAFVLLSSFRIALLLLYCSHFAPPRFVALLSCFHVRIIPFYPMFHSALALAGLA